MSVPAPHPAGDVIRALDGQPSVVYCASEQAIIAATEAYAETCGKLADSRGLAAALIAAHAPDLGLDRSVCLRDLVEAPERSRHVRGAK